MSEFLPNSCSKCGLYPGSIILITPQGTQKICPKCKSEIHKEFFGNDFTALPIPEDLFNLPIQDNNFTIPLNASIGSIMDMLGFKGVPSLNPIPAKPSFNTGSCPKCGWTLDNFIQKGRWGCPYDYTFFEKEARLLLQQIHGSQQHVGKVPTKILTMDQLKIQLEKAVKEERFEDAAKFRDAIKSKLRQDLGIN